VLQKVELTNKTVVFATPGRHQVTGTKGLYLYVSPGGDTRRWIFRFTSPATRRVTETGLGLWPEVALGDAKTKAGGLRKQIANGVCPIRTQRQERSARVTFKEAAEGWIETHKAAWKGGDNSSQMKNAVLLLYGHGAPLAGKRVAEITPDIIHAALKELWSRAPDQGRRTLGMWERVFDYAKAKGWRQGDNPCSWRGCFEYRLPRRRASDRGHHRALPYEQIPAFMKELRQHRGCTALALEFTVLTCTRTSEALGAGWAEVDFENRLWTIPKARMKAGKEHVVPLSTRAIEILKYQQQHSQGEHVFTGSNKTRLRSRAMWNMLHEMGIKASVHRASVHGFRASFRDWAGDMTTFQREIIEECLAHQVGSDVERAYRRTTALEKRREIMQSWSMFCGGEQ
jgi:integrase